ncbi:MAG: extracellular solute-binding protein [Clostridia bacterium]|nr:extracellular solute-binding protein [Clostridia bacterium]
MSKKWIKWSLNLMLILSLVLSLMACGGEQSTPKATSAPTGTTTSGKATEPTETEDPFLTGEKPELNILMYYLPYDMHEQPSHALIEELTGYKIHWFNLPQENPVEKLMLDIAGGVSYDLIDRAIDGAAYGQLKAQNALLPVDTYLEKYGDNILAAVSDIAWKAVTGDDGKRYGIPLEAFDGPRDETGDPYGVLKGGLGFRSDALESIGMELPTTIDELYNVLKAYQDATGKIPFTSAATGWYNFILSGFGMGDAGWYEVDGTYVPRIKHPEMIEYLKYVQKLYAEGLLDNDMPINATANAREKYSSGNAMATPLYFWDIPSMKAALETSNPNCKNLIATFLAPDKNTKPIVYVNQGISNIACIPKTSKNPEHAIIWFNILSDKDNFRKIYIGEEGVSYEIKDGKYYPIFPKFQEYENADKFTGVVQSDVVFQMWQARARKTPEMAEAYDQMNSRIGDYVIKPYYDSYASSLPAVMNSQLTLNTMINDKLIKAIAEGTDAQAALDDIIAEWDKNGGLEQEQAINEWYDKNF